MPIQSRAESYFKQLKPAGWTASLAMRRLVMFCRCDSPGETRSFLHSGMAGSAPARGMNLLERLGARIPNIDEARDWRLTVATIPR